MNQEEAVAWQLSQLQSQYENGEYGILFQKSNRILQILNSRKSSSDSSSTAAKKQLLATLQARCFALLKLGRTKEALESIEKLLSNPIDSFVSKERKAEILYYRAYALYSLYQLEEALETCQRIRDLDIERDVVHLEAQILFRKARLVLSNQVMFSVE